MNYDNDPTIEKHRVRRGGFLMGTLIILIGVLFLLQNMNVIYVDRIGRFWPVLLIAFGVSRIVERRFRWSLFGGIGFIVVGVLLLLGNLGYIAGNTWNYIWPVLLIAWGLQMLFREPRFGRHGHRRWKHWRHGEGAHHKVESTGTEDQLDENAVFGAVRRRLDSRKFEGGEINAVFGSVEIDLHGASTTQDEVRVDVHAVFGSVELTVPAQWKVTVRGQGVFGSFEDKTLPGAENARPHLIVSGEAVFGSVEVRS